MPHARMLAPRSKGLARKLRSDSLLAAQGARQSSDAHACIQRTYRRADDEYEDPCWQRRFEDAQSAFRDHLNGK